MIGQTNLDESYIFEISIKMRFFDVAIGIKIPFFRVLVTIEPGRSLLQFVTTNCLKRVKVHLTITGIASIKALAPAAFSSASGSSPIPASR